MTLEKEQEIINDTHELNIASAGISYVNLPSMTITDLADSFKVSRAVISEWLLDAARKGYVEDINKLTRKHTKEYESFTGITSHTLRNEYSKITGVSPLAILL